MTTTLAFLGDFGDAIQFIFRARARERHAGGRLPVPRADLGPPKLTLVAMAIACALSIPVGLGSATRPGRVPGDHLSNVGRAVPSLALIAFFVAYLGVGFATSRSRSCCSRSRRS